MERRSQSIIIQFTKKIMNDCYYLVDGIYQNWAKFIDTFTDGMIRKHKTFGSAQESVRKDIEREFGVMISRWHILPKPCMYMDRSMCKKVMMAAIIMHNIIVEMRRDGYQSEMFEEGKKYAANGMFIDVDGNEKTLNWKTIEGIIGGQLLREMDWAKHLVDRYVALTDELEHFSLKNDLVEHV